MSATVWGPHYWFFMMSVALSYPDFPNDATKRKYYDFFMNLPIFIPDPEMGNQFSKMLDKYPLIPDFAIFRQQRLAHSLGSIHTQQIQ